MPWIRSGACNGCGACCIGDPYAANEAARSEAMKRKPAVPGYCPLFEWHGSSGFCAGHEPPNQDPYYLAGCITWPQHPNNIRDKPECSYSFTWLDLGDGDDPETSTSATIIR